MAVIIEYHPNVFAGEVEKYAMPAGVVLRDVLPQGFRGEVEVDDVSVGPHLWHGTILEEGQRVRVVHLPGEPVTIGFIVAGTILATGLSFAASRLLAPKAPVFDANRGEEAETPRFRGTQTTVGPGQPIPIILGKTRVSGHIIETFTDTRFDEWPTDGNTTLIAESEEAAETARRLNTRLAIGWGPIQSITDLQIDDNSVSLMRGVAYQTDLGTRRKTIPTGFSESKVARSVNAAVSVAGGAVERETQGEVDAIEIHLVFPSGLYQVAANGQLRTREVTVEVSYRGRGTVSWTSLGQKTIAGAVQGVKDVYLRTPKLTPGVYDIQVKRITADTADSTVQDEFSWEDYQEVVSNGQAHPGLAEVAIRHIPQEQTQAPRTYSVLVEGRNDLRIYSDANTYTTGFSSNPAWCVLWMLTNTRLGFGRFYDYDDVKIADFVAWAKHNDALVDGTPRNVFGYEFRQTASGFDVLRVLTEAHDGRLYLEGGKWRVAVDTTRSMRMLFTEGAYRDGTLTYQAESTHERPTRINGIFRNEDREYIEDNIPLADPTLDPGARYLETDVKLYGVQAPAQVVRQVEKMIRRARLADASIEFQTSWAAMRLRPGDVFGVATNAGGVALANGRLRRVSADLQTIGLDWPVSLTATQTYELVVEHGDGTIETHAFVASTTETTREVTITTPWTTEPAIGEKYAVTSTASALELFEVESRTLGEDMSVLIRGRKYDAEIYTQTLSVEGQTITQILPSTTKIPDAVTDLTLTQRDPQDSGGSTRPVIDVSWTAPSGVFFLDRYDVLWQEDGDAGWQYAGSTRGTRLTLREDFAAATYKVCVVAVSTAGRRRHPEDCTIASITIT